MTLKVSETKDGRLMVEDGNLGFIVGHDEARALVAELQEVLCEGSEPVECTYIHVGLNFKRHAWSCSRCGHVAMAHSRSAVPESRVCDGSLYPDKTETDS